jgi:hypothetical protein
MKTDKKDVIQEALRTIQELDALYDSDNIINIGQLCNKLSNLTVNIAKMVSDARKLYKELEADYDNTVESEQLAYISKGEGVAKAKSMASVDNFSKKKDCLTAEDGYERLKRFLDRCDKVLDSNKQYCSTVKNTNLKGI